MCSAEDSLLNPDLTEMVRRLEQLLGQPHVSTDYVRFRIDLLKAQWHVRTAVARVGHLPRRGSGSGKDGAAPGVCARISPDNLCLDRRLLAELFAALRGAIERSGGLTAEAERLAAIVETDTTVLETLARCAALEPDGAHLETMAQERAIPADALEFFGRALAAPFLADAARRVAAERDWTVNLDDAPGCCPACGSPPGLARLRRDDGRRMLHCGLCGLSWAFPRLACPFCGTRNREVLTFLRVSEADPRWVEACEACRHYVKTVDERKLGGAETVIPLVEDTGTLHLDLLAEKEGYRRRAAYTALT